jgi:hypothetical protein
MSGFMIDLPGGASMDYRPILVDVLVHHVRTPTSGCYCGGVPLGASWPEHICDVYEEAVVKAIWEATS